MHFWIDKRSQAYSFNGRHGVPPSLASGRRNKSIITPLHRFHSLENISIPQVRRPNLSSTPRMARQQSTRTQAPVVRQEPITETTDTTTRHHSEVVPSTHVDIPAADRTAENATNSQFMKLGGFTKYGMWISFGLTTLSIVATRIYSDYQGTFEIFLLCTLGLIGSGLLISCMLAICRTKPPPHLVNLHPYPVSTRAAATVVETPDVLNHRDIVISTITTTQPVQNVEDQPPPPYDVAVLLPAKNLECAEFPPPPSYENAVQ